MRILRNGYTVKPAGGSSAWTDGSAASTLLLDEFFGPPAISATVTATEAADTLTATGTLALKGSTTATEAADTLTSTATVTGGLSPISGSVTATEAADTLSATATITQPTVAAPAALPTASGGYGLSSERPVPPKHLTTLVFSDDPSPRPVSQEEPPRGLSTAEAPAAEDYASRPSAAAPSPETVAALASTLAGQVELAALPAMPELIAGNDDEEAMMIILALAA